MIRPSLSGILFVAMLGAAGCSGSGTRGDGVVPDPAFPRGYTSWKKINAAPIVREGEQMVRELYANDVAQKRGGPGATFPLGAVLVKEERALVNDAGKPRPGDLVRISVMSKVGNKVGEGAVGGWTFKAYDPSTMREFNRDRVDPDGCYFCHADAAARDYVYSDL